MLIGARLVTRLGCLTHHLPLSKWRPGAADQSQASQGALDGRLGNFAKSYGSQPTRLSEDTFRLVGRPEYVCLMMKWPMAPLARLYDTSRLRCARGPVTLLSLVVVLLLLLFFATFLVRTQ